ncbi:MAG: hypothetical protein ACOX5R_13830 [bacterium]
MCASSAVKIRDYKKGDKISGRTIVDIVGRNNDFMVCTVSIYNGTGVHWISEDTYTFSDDQRTHLAAFNDRYDLVKKILPNDAGAVEALALALYNGLCSPDENPRVIFKGIDSQIAAVKEEASARTRVVYGISAVIAFVFLFAILLSYSLNIDPEKVLVQIPVTVLLLSAAFGSLGALSSVLLKLPKIEVSCYPGWFTAGFGGSTRIVFGSIFGMIALSAAYAGLILTSILDMPGGPLLIGFCGGFSERLAPELITMLEGGKTGRSEKKEGQPENTIVV